MAALSNIGNTAVALAPANTFCQYGVEIYTDAITNTLYIGVGNTVTAAISGNSINSVQDNTCGTIILPNSKTIIPAAVFRNTVTGNADASTLFVVAGGVGPVRLTYRAM